MHDACDQCARKRVKLLDAECNTELQFLSVHNACDQCARKREILLDAECNTLIPVFVSVYCMGPVCACVQFISNS